LEAGTSSGRAPLIAGRVKFGASLALVLTCVYFVARCRWTPDSQGNWAQGNDPMGRWWLSAAIASLPLIVLLLAIGFARIPAHKAALIGLVTCLFVATTVHHMPVKLALAAAAYGAAYGIFPICWIIIPVLFLFQLTARSGRLDALKESLVGITPDSRLQLVLIAFALGAFLEGASGFGTPVAVCGALLVGLGFDPFQASIATLMADTAPVAFGSLGIPITTLSAVSGIDSFAISRVVALLLIPFCILIPFLLTTSYAGKFRARGVWPPVLLSGSLFATLQYFLARIAGPNLVDIVAALGTIGALLFFLRAWKPAAVYDPQLIELPHQPGSTSLSLHCMWRGWSPWIALSLVLALWSIPDFSHFLDAHTTLRLPIPGLHLHIYRTPPVVPHAMAEPAILTFNWLSATGTASMIGATLAGLLIGIRPSMFMDCFKQTLHGIRFTVITIAAMLAFGFVSRYAGIDAAIGLAFAHTHRLYPFFGTFVGWLGTLSTGSDTSSNVLFGSLQTVAARQIGVSPVLMCSANTVGGVMGKMIAAPTLVIAATATGRPGQEGRLLRYLLPRSLALCALVGLLVILLAYVPGLGSFTSK